MKTVTVDNVRARLSFLEGLNARGVGTAVPQQQFEIACLRELLALLVCRPMPVTVTLPQYRNSPDMHTKQFYEAIGFNQGLDIFIEALRAAGIGVKGE